MEKDKKNMHYLKRIGGAKEGLIIKILYLYKCKEVMGV